MRLRLASLSPLACLLAFPLTSQVADTARFHRGQWGVDFQIWGGFAGAGAIHFTSPTRAVVFDLTGQYSHASAAMFGQYNTVNTTLSLGTRAYRYVEAHVARWTTFGLSLLYGYQHSTQGTSSEASEGVGGGLFANLGATWLVTPHLGLGAQWQVNVTYMHNSDSSSLGSGSSDMVTVALARVALTGQLYF